VLRATLTLFLDGEDVLARVDDEPLVYVLKTLEARALRELLGG
jgi:hypothetical protein